MDTATRTISNHSDESDTIHMALLSRQRLVEKLLPMFENESDQYSYKKYTKELAMINTLLKEIY